MMKQEDAYGTAPQERRERSSQGAGQRRAECEGQRETGQQPQQEGAVD